MKQPVLFAALLAGAALAATAPAHARGFGGAVGGGGMRGGIGGGGFGGGFMARGGTGLGTMERGGLGGGAGLAPGGSMLGTMERGGLGGGYGGYGGYGAFGGRPFGGQGIGNSSLGRGDNYSLGGGAQNNYSLGRGNNYSLGGGIGDRGWPGGDPNGFRGPQSLPTDGGWGNHVGNTNINNLSNHVTQHWGNTYINNGTINVRNNWNSWGRWHGAGGWYGPGWYGTYPGAWLATGWLPATPWDVTGYPALTTLWGLGGGGGQVPYPVDYDYGNTIVYQGDQVYVNGDPTATSQQYYDQASQLAAAGQNQPPANSDWKPLGVFGLVQPNDTSATQIFQMAVNNQGIIGGNYTNALTNTVLPIKGSINKQTQRAAWTIGTNTSTVYEAGAYNLTQDSAPCLMHVGANTTQQWLLVRLQQPSQSQAGAAGGGQ